MDVEYETAEKERIHIRLGSVRELREEVMEAAHNGPHPILWTLITDLTELFANHTFVGILDSWRRLAAIQHNTKLYLVDYGAIRFFHTLFLHLFKVMNSFIKSVSLNLGISDLSSLQKD